jgi:hypothetical protein
VQVAQPEPAAGERVRGRATDAVAALERQRAPPESDRGGRRLVWEYVHVAIDDATRLAYVEGAALDPASFDVDQLARMPALVAVRRLRRLQPRELAQLDPLKMPDSVESGNPSTSAICAAVGAAPTADRAARPYRRSGVDGGATASAHTNHALSDAEGRVAVQLHPEVLLGGVSGFDTSQPPRRPRMDNVLRNHI